MLKWLDRVLWPDWPSTDKVPSIKSTGTQGKMMAKFKAGDRVAFYRAIFIPGRYRDTGKIFRIEDNGLVHIQMDDGGAATVHSKQCRKLVKRTGIKFEVWENNATGAKVAVGAGEQIPLAGHTCLGRFRKTRT